MDLPWDEMIEQVGTGDIDAVVETLVASHRDYVWERWAVPFDDRAERLALMYRADLHAIAFPFGEVWAVDDAASVAIWVPHGARARLTDVDHAELNEASVLAFGANVEAVSAASEALAAVTPIEPDWYLATMGTRPARQGEGLGSAVLRPMLERCDDASLNAGLETSDERNISFYGRLGFVALLTVSDLPHGAPPTWIMQRLPVKAPRFSAACSYRLGGDLPGRA
jgi:GNAT superfamily N-acetyltransferase